MLRIDDNYRIETEDESNCTLIFAEKKLRTKKETTETEEYTVEQKFYYPTIHLCLKRYLDLEMKKASDVQNCVKLIETTYKKIKTLNLTNS